MDLPSTVDQAAKPVDVGNGVAQQDRLLRIGSGQPLGAASHCVTGALEITGPLRPDVIQRALDHVLAARPALRSRFDPASGQHTICPPGPVALTRPELAGTDEQARWEQAHRHARAASVRPFPVGAVPLLRAELFAVGQQRHLLVLYADQLACDAWSINLVLDDFVTAADAFARDEEPPAPTEDGYPALRRRHNARLTSRAGTAAVQRRRDQLTDALRRWPIDAQPGPPDAEELAQVTVDVADDDAYELLRRLYGTADSPFGVAAVALRIALAVPDGKTYLLGSTVAGRETDEEGTVVGWFSTEAMIGVPAGTGPVAACLAGVRRAVLTALGDQLVPEALLRDAGVDPGGGLALSMMFLPNQLSGGAGGVAPAIGAARAVRTAVDICPTGADLDLFLVEEPPPGEDGTRPLLRLGAVSQPRITSDEQVRALLHRWRAALAALAWADWANVTVAGLAADLAATADQLADA